MSRHSSISRTRQQNNDTNHTVQNILRFKNIFLPIIQTQFASLQRHNWELATEMLEPKFAPAVEKILIPSVSNLLNMQVLQTADNRYEASLFPDSEIHE